MRGRPAAFLMSVGSALLGGVRSMRAAHPARLSGPSRLQHIIRGAASLLSPTWLLGGPAARAAQDQQDLAFLLGGFLIPAEQYESYRTKLREDLFDAVVLQDSNNLRGDVGEEASVLSAVQGIRMRLGGRRPHSLALLGHSR